MAQTASSSSSPFPYDVFLSFRGEDTRLGFTGNLNKDLRSRGIRTFFDEVGLKGGDSIKPSLFKAIENSRTAIIVFSKNYASSTFCLDELVNINACIKDKGRRVFPVFYDVDPSDVRHQRGSYQEALTRHEEKFKDDTDKLQNWRMALFQAANLTGYHFKHGAGYEYQFIEKIMKDVSNEINAAPLHVSDCLFGMDSRVVKVMELLDISSDRVHMVGIHGIGGMGKTTLAWAVYNLIVVRFASVCFLEGVREKSDKNGLNFLQEMLLSKLTGEKDIIFTSAREGISEIIKRLHQKKVLLVLDDVNASEQLHDLVGEPDWFGPGSRVIITTRDKHLLANHGVERIYEVDELNETEALELFRRNAFKNDVVPASFEDIINRAVTYASGLPLALEVIGSNLFGKSVKEWNSALDRYERIPNEKIQKILKVSFDALKEDEQSVFLDIACCFKGYRLVEVEAILHAHHGDCMTYHIGELVEKSLIKISKDGEVTLHDLIENMGKDIVRQESPKEPWKRSRLWFHEEILQVLQNNKGTSNIEMIYLHFPKFEEVVDWDGKAFEKMTNLKTLIIKNGHFSEGPKQLTNSLRVLQWWGIPSLSLPSNFDPTELAVFMLPHSSLESLQLPMSPKVLVNLRVLDFSRCECITEIGDVSAAPNLEEISFQGCENLIKIDESVGFLHKLRILDAFGCTKLMNFPSLKLTSLEKLNLSYCSSLERFPEILGEMEDLAELYLEDTPIKKLPFSIGNHTRLQKIKPYDVEWWSIGPCEELQLSEQDEDEELGEELQLSEQDEDEELEDCNISNEFLRIGLTWFAKLQQLDLSGNNLTIVPECIKECLFLRKLNLSRCRFLQEIRGIPPNIESFQAERCTSLKQLDLRLLPACTEECSFLRRLILDDCKNLQEIRGIPSNLEFLSAGNCKALTPQFRSTLMKEVLYEAGGKEFCFPATTIPGWFEHQSKGLPISFWFRNKLPAISLCFVAHHSSSYSFKWHRLDLIINGKKMSPFDFSYRDDHIVIFDLKRIQLEDNVNKVLLENEWNHGVFSVDFVSYPGWTPVSKPDQIQIGLHVLEQKCSMEDIRFNDPNRISATDGGGSSSSFTYEFVYDVFLSFRGQDTRFSFTGNLYKALHDRGIRTFVDDFELERGDSIMPSLINAIENSRTAIIVFSKNYASSSFCLDALVNIISSINDKGRWVFPVFYDVDPSDVRHQRGSYREALACQEERFNDDKEKLHKWRMALRQATDLPGFHFKLGDGYEYQFIEKITKDVSNKINPAPLHLADRLIGMDSRVLKVMELMDISSDRVHMVGIHGIGGIGKTTLAWAVYNSVAVHFDGVCFLERVRENSNTYGLKYLQGMLLSKLTGKKDITFTSVREGISEIVKRLQHKKVLLILDDANASEQLHDLVGEPDWFGPGSRVIITTRDRHLLAMHGVEKTYEVDGLNKIEALELLRSKAFKNNVVVQSFNDILNRVVACAYGLPLALEVIGSHLSKTNKKDWKSALDEYERIPNEDIQKILEVSFGALKEEEKSVFLDIACCYKGFQLKEVEDILCAHRGSGMKHHIGELFEKSLVKISWDGEVTLNDLIEDMGKEIVRRESPKKPWKRSRLWFHEDIVQVLQNNKGTCEIEIIYLHFPKFEGRVNWDGEALKKMTNLKTLIIKNGHFSKCPEQLPESLRVLEWWGFPSLSLPLNSKSVELALFRLPESSLKLLELPKMFVNLKVLDFSRCECITEIGDVSAAPCLEEMSFQECENLSKVHESVGFLDKLRILNAFGCSKLCSFPSIKLTSLNKLELSCCFSLENFPEILVEMKYITELYLSGTAIKKFPFSIENLSQLQKIELEACRWGQIEIPSSIVMLPELEQMSVWECEELQFYEREEDEKNVSSNVKCLNLINCKISYEFLQISLTWFANVEELVLSESKFTILPECLKECHSLRILNLNQCWLLQEIRGIPPKIELFDAKGCTSLKELDLTLLPKCTKECRFLRRLILDDCKNLQEIRGIPPNLAFLSATRTLLTTQCRSMLMNEELHEAGGKMIFFPGTSIPEWFEHQKRGQSISFWFRNKFPVISLCHFTGQCPSFSSGKLHLVFFINGNKSFPFNFSCTNDHILIFDPKCPKWDGMDAENEWNHVVFSIDFVPSSTGKLVRNQQIGLHVFNKRCRMEDIRFNDPK